MNRLLRNIGHWIVFLFLLTACSTTKFVPDGAYLLDEIQIVSEGDRPAIVKASDLKPYVRQQPNFKLFGLLKWQLYLYGWSGRNERRWINRQLRKMGEAPVLLDTMLIGQSEAELQRYLVNKGFVHAEVTTEIDTLRAKKAVVSYKVNENEPYRIRDYTIRLSDPRIDSIAHLAPRHRSRFLSAFRSSQDEYNSLVHPGDLFDRDQLDRERERISTLMRMNGYFAFNKEYVGYIADSAFRENVVSLDLTLRPYRMVQPNGEVVDHPHRQYYIRNVKVLTDYNNIGIGEEAGFTPTDTLWSRDIQIIYGLHGRSLRPGVLRRSTFLRPGRLFNERDVEQTYSAFATLRALRNVNIRFTEVEERDTMKLDCEIQTSPAKINTIGLDVEGTNSAGDFGFASSVTYQHRNLFHGSEVFSARFRGAYEALSGAQTDGFGNYWEMGAESSLQLPRFLLPYVSKEFQRYHRATTEAKISYNLQTRPEYTRAILSGGLSYGWQGMNNQLARHTFRLIDLSYIFLPKKNEEFINSLPDYMVLYNYTNHFIMSMGYTYNFTNYSPQNRQRDTHSLRASVEFAGNLLNAFSHLFGATKNADGCYELFGTEYAQYVKLDFDYSKAIVLDSRNKLAYHVGVGVGVPYGNSDYLPFERAYFSGGANSVRGWSVRELGPGGIPKDLIFSYALQNGDIRLDLNVEYRTKLFWKFELAAYVDAGNVWSMRKFESEPNGNFDFSRFYKEIALSYGLGLRMDFDFFLLRLDTGFKAYDPQQTGSRRWAIKRPNFKDNFALHFAVGYPF